ncbi:hypothetical protein P7K49_037015 [Saguinus oedipus]|uniref:Uncharacterized protein n=1 Tax=Saguinus oedipus TaxID=9490 RepID=A0ABQ9TLS3_SAGOE|nr:hypothetical protein P7K49_037015 [Saguinus oedipus]
MKEEPTRAGHAHEKNQVSVLLKGSCLTPRKPLPTRLVPAGPGSAMLLSQPAPALPCTFLLLWGAPGRKNTPREQLCELGSLRASTSRRGDEDLGPRLPGPGSRRDRCQLPSTMVMGTTLSHQRGTPGPSTRSL